MDAIRDPIYVVLSGVQGSIGSVGLWVVLFFAYFGVTAVIAGSDIRFSRYRNTGADAPFFENVSTLADFAVLNPLFIVLAVRSTTYMLLLPSLLQGSLGLRRESFDAATGQFAARIDSLLACVVCLVAAALGWAVYSRSLRAPEDCRPYCRNGRYIGIMTTLLMYIGLTYFYRAIVTTVYVLDVTREGFKLQEAVWRYGTRVLGRFETGFGWVAAVIALTAIIFAVHDLWLYRTGRVMRLVIVAALAATSILVYVGGLVGIHDNLSLVLDQASIRVVLGAGVGSPGLQTQLLAYLNAFPRWTLNLGDVVGLVSSQLAAIGATLVSGDALRDRFTFLRARRD